MDKLIFIFKRATTITLTCFFLFTLQSIYAGDEIDITTGWRFHTGDDLKWADSDFNDSDWAEILGDRYWEEQGYENYDGYAWYRIKVFIPSTIIEKAYYKDDLQFIIGNVDDTEQTFLNGKLIGQNGVLIPGDTEVTDDFTGDREAYRIIRKYVLPVNDSRILWDQENTIAIRVHDHGGNGGMYGTKSYISMLDLKEFFKIRTNETTFQLSWENEFRKTIELENISEKDRYEGRFSVEILRSDNRKLIYESSWDVLIVPGQKKIIEYGFNSPYSISHQALYTFEEKANKTIVSTSQMVPYILTPKPEKEPKINGAKVYGVRPDSPFLYRIPATGNRPMKFTVQGLPPGLQVDENSGIITGKISSAGTYPVLLKAQNAFGESTGEFRIVVGSTLALTPPMGWNSWYIHYHRVSDKLMREAADAMINSGMANFGYQYVNIDDCWMVKANSDDPVIGGRIRDERGEILTNRKFPDMKAMTNYIHSKGLKAGTYISPGPTTCGGYAGSYQHEKQDAQTFAEWGFDFLKYDWCSYRRIAKDRSIHEFQKPYKLMWDELQKLDRDVVFNLCQYGMGEVWQWGDDVGNSWRTTGDLGLEHSDELPGFYKIGMSNAQHWEYAKPGAWNDPDYILIGWVGSAFITGEGRLTTLSPDEQYFYMSMWSLMASPLIFSGDMAKLDPFTLNILCNNEVIDVNQDELGKQAAILRNANNKLVMVKNLEDGSKAVGLFNLDDQSKKIAVNWADLNIENKQLVRDLWRQKDLGVFEDEFEQIVPPHGVVLIKVSLK